VLVTATRGAEFGTDPGERARMKLRQRQVENPPAHEVGARARVAEADGTHGTTPPADCTRVVEAATGVRLRICQAPTAANSSAIHW